MGAMAILLGLGICIFLLWFFESVMMDFVTDEMNETEYREVYLDKVKTDFYKYNQ